MGRGRVGKEEGEKGTHGNLCEGGGGGQMNTDELNAYANGCLSTTIHLHLSHEVTMVVCHRGTKAGMHFVAWFL